MTQSMSDPARLSKILDAGFVASLSDTSDEELRARLRESREVEEEVSFVRRLLHGRLDILRAELEARRGGRGTARSLEALQDALADGSAGRTRGARAPVAALTSRARAQEVVSDDHLVRLPDLDAAEIEDAIGRASAEERRVSNERRRLHEVIDVLEAELAGRYRAGLAPPV